MGWELFQRAGIFPELSVMENPISPRTPLPMEGRLELAQSRLWSYSLSLPMRSQMAGTLSVGTADAGHCLER